MARKKKSKKSKARKTKKPREDQNISNKEEIGFLSGKERKSLEYLYMALFLGSIVFGLVYLAGLIRALIY